MMNNQMNANSINMNDSADKENMQPSVPPTPCALPQPQQQQFPMAPQTWPMPGTLTPMLNQAPAPGIANPSGSDVAAENTPAENENLPDWKIQFAEVPGRLTLLNPQKYQITRSEIKRRLGKPEHLNLCALNGILRKTKEKKATDDLTKQLAKFDVNLEKCQRKSVPSTVFTTLTEGEAKQVVTDFRGLTDKHFYDKELAFESLARTTTIAERAVKINRTLCSQMAMQDIFRVLDKAVSPVCDEPTDAKSTLHPQTQEAFDNFSKVTHGFGLPALRVSWDAYNKTLGECAKAYANPMAFCYELQRLRPDSMKAMFGLNGDQKPEPTPASSPPVTPMPNMNSSAGMERAKKTTPKSLTNQQDKQ